MTTNLKEIVLTITFYTQLFTIFIQSIDYFIMQPSYQVY